MQDFTAGSIAGTPNKAQTTSLHSSNLAMLRRKHSYPTHGISVL